MFLSLILKAALIWRRPEKRIFMLLCNPSRMIRLWMLFLLASVPVITVIFALTDLTEIFGSCPIRLRKPMSSATVLGCFMILCLLMSKKNTRNFPIFSLFFLLRKTSKSSLKCLFRRR